jgi:hypothetical protein
MFKTICMKKILPFFCVLIYLISCKKEGGKSNPLLPFFTNQVWLADTNEIIVNNATKTRVKFDSLNQKMVGDTLIPIVFWEDKIITTQHAGKLDKDRKKIIKDTLLIDTFGVEYKLINGKGRLILRNDKRILTLTAQNTKAPLKERSNFQPIEFKIEGHTIGDTIDRKSVEVKSALNMKTYALETVALKSNPNITFDLISDNIIYSISKMSIADGEMEDVKKVVSLKMGFEPEHKAGASSTNPDYFVESYKWSKKQTKIILLKTKYVGNDPFSKLAALKVKEFGLWNLSYDNNYSQALLRLSVEGKSKPKSIDIE